MAPSKILNVALVALACGCGQLGDPLPPLLNIPSRVEGLAVRQVEDGLIVEWTAPLLTTEGVVIEEPQKMILYAVEIARDGAVPPPEALEPYFAVAAEVEGAEAGEGAETELPATPRFGQRTAIAARALSADGKFSPWSELAVLEVVEPPAAPAELAAEAAPDGVRLRWNAVDRAQRYRVERAAGEDFEAVAVVEQSDWLDPRAAFGETYRYRVRALVAEAPGPPSDSVSITPIDKFAPAAPQSVRAIRTDASVELSWAPSPVSDLAGYEVRRGGEALHQQLLRAPAFSDAQAPAGSVAYEVRAIDQKGNRSEPATITVE